MVREHVQLMVEVAGVGAGYTLRDRSLSTGRRGDNIIIGKSQV